MTLRTQNNPKPENLAGQMQILGDNARRAAKILRLASAQTRTKAIQAMASTVSETAAEIIAANVKDVENAAAKGLSPAMVDRLVLNSNRVEAMAKGLNSVADLPDILGSEDDRWTRPNGLTISKVRTPIGVIGMIYESRPNVTADAAALCVKSGNAVILRGGSEAIHSNMAIHKAIQTALHSVGLSKTCVQYVDTTDRAAVGYLLGGLENNIDLIIPRGGKGLVARVQSDARVPVLAHLEGLNHTYVHASANLDMARKVVTNAKMRRTGVCGATETLLIDAAIAETALPVIAAALHAENCELRGDKKAQAIVPNIAKATPDDFATEHLAAIINVKIVDGIDDALTHIDTYGSGHTDAIIAGNEGAAKKFLREVDSAIVVYNASTQYADGGEFGFGAEIGIATGRMHARGPVGAQHLTSYKYQVLGSGQVRPL